MSQKHSFHTHQSEHERRRASVAALPVVPLNNRALAQRFALAVVLALAAFAVVLLGPGTPAGAQSGAKSPADEAEFGRRFSEAVSAAESAETRISNYEFGMRGAEDAARNAREAADEAVKAAQRCDGEEYRNQAARARWRMKKAREILDNAKEDLERAEQRLDTANGNLPWLEAHASGDGKRGVHWLSNKIADVRKKLTEAKAAQQQRREAIETVIRDAEARLESAIALSGVHCDPLVAVLPDLAPESTLGASIPCTFAPDPAMRTIGTATINGQPAAAGTTVTATVGTTTCGTTQTTVGGVYVIDVASASTMSGCGTDGETVTFSVGRVPARQTVTFRSSASEWQDLSVLVPVPSPSPAGVAEALPQSPVISLPPVFTPPTSISVPPVPRSITPPLQNGTVGAPQPSQGSDTAQAPSPAQGTPQATPPPTQGARLEVSKTSARVGETFTVTGRNFTPNTDVRVCWVGPGGRCQMELFSGSTGSGTFRFPCYVPNVAPGMHTIDATDAHGARAAVGFTVVH